MLHPVSKRLIKVIDASNRNNRGLWNLATKSFEEIERGNLEGENTKILIDIISQAMEKGLRFADFSRIPKYVVEQAREKLKEKLGQEKFDEVIDTDHVTTTTVESFKGAFEKKTVTANEIEGWQQGNATGDYVAELLLGREVLMRSIKTTLEEMGPHRCYVIWRVKMGKVITRRLQTQIEGERLDEEIQEARVTAFSSSGDQGKMEFIKNADDIEEAVDAMNARLLELMEIYVERGSGWTYIDTLSLDIYSSKMLMGMEKRNLASISLGNEAGQWKKLPKWLGTRRVSNPKPPKPSQDVKCFLWATLRGLNPTDKNGGKCKDLLELENDVTIPTGITYPIPIANRVFRRIEEANPTWSFSVFNLGNKAGEVQPLYVSKERGKRVKHLMLGIVFGDHFVLINSLSALFPKQVHNHRVYYCENCLASFKTERHMEEHWKDCVGMNEPTRIKMPKEGEKDQTLYFKNWQYRLPAPFVIYADIEALTKPVDGDQNALNIHKPVAWSYSISCTYERHKTFEGWNGLTFNEVRSYAGENSMHQLLEALAVDSEVMETIVNNHLPYVAQEGDHEDYKAARRCHICEKKFVSDKDKKVLDHDHMTGKYRGAAHSSCNACFSSSKYYKIPVVFHNLKNYDAFHILRGLKGWTDGVEDIKVIAKNLDKFTSFTIDNLRFIDSFGFLMSSLETNVDIVRKAITTREEKWRVFDPVVKAFGVTTDEELDLLLAKGIYPYEYMTHMDILKQTELPPREAFWSVLYGDGITEAEYVRAKDMWSTFNCQTLEDYTLLYVKLDTILLQVVFDGFRRKCIEEDRLDPVHFVTAPSLAWAAMLLNNWRNDVVIENMTDLEMLMMVKKGVRGGMCQVMKPFARSKDPEETYCGKESKILYLDANNLYGKAMCWPMPYGGYRWEYNEWHVIGERAQHVNEEADSAGLRVQFEEPPSDDGAPAPFVELETHMFDLPDFDWGAASLQEQRQYILNMDEEGERGYVLEVDVEVPNELHDELNDYPLMPEQKQCFGSEWTRQQYEKVGMRIRPDGSASTVKKLVSDLEDKHKYVIHYRNLQQAIRLGYKLTKVWRVFSFKQSRWLKSYIDKNTAKRKLAKLAKDVVGVSLYKLYNNSIYGKFVEDVEKRRNVKFFLNSSLDKALRAAATPNVKAWKIVLEDELLVMEMAKKSITMSRPIIIGFSVLELSKFHMFDFHYNKVKPYWGSNATLLYTDTDSTVYKIKAMGTYVDYDLADFQRHVKALDLSELRADHWLLTQDLPRFAGELGYFKDEMGGKGDIKVFIALRCKMYSLLIQNSKEELEEISKMKGISKKATVELSPFEILQKMAEAPTATEAMGVVERHFKETRRKLTFQDYMEVFQGELGREVTFNVIQQKRTTAITQDGKNIDPSDREYDKNTYQLTTARVRKRGLANTDDKSYYLSANKSLRYGHWRINEFELSKEMENPHNNVNVVAEFY